MRGAFIKKTRIAPMRTDGSFHGFFTLAPLPTAWGLMRRRRNGSPRIFSHAESCMGECHTLLICEKSVEIGEICGRQLSAQCAKEQAECIYSPTDRTDKHRYHAGCLYQKNTDCTDAHGWVFSRILYSCSATYRLGFDAPSAQRIATDFFACGELYGRMSHALDMRKICGNRRDLWATTKRTMR